jgi:hypothetical protein
MAESSWDSILRNREQYPDSMTVDLGGVQVPLGELRNSVIPKQDMTKLTQGWSQREQQARQQIDMLQTQLAQALSAVPQEPSYDQRSLPGQGDGPLLVDYSRDPILAPLHQMALQERERGMRTEQTLSTLEKTLQALGQQLAQWPVLMALDKIKQHDEFGVDPQQLVQFAVQRRQGPPNLQEDYQLFTMEARLAKARAEAEQAAYEKAKQELATSGSGVPYMPFGPPRTLSLPDPVYSSLDEAEAAALNDPELLGIIMGQAS